MGTVIQESFHRDRLEEWEILISHQENQGNRFNVIYALNLETQIWNLSVIRTGNMISEM